MRLVVQKMANLKSGASYRHEHRDQAENSCRGLTRQCVQHHKVEETAVWGGGGALLFLSLPFYHRSPAGAMRG